MDLGLNTQGAKQRPAGGFTFIGTLVRTAVRPDLLEAPKVGKELAHQLLPLTNFRTGVWHATAQLLFTRSAAIALSTSSSISSKMTTISNSRSASVSPTTAGTLRVN